MKQIHYIFLLSLFLYPLIKVKGETLSPEANPTAYLLDWTAPIVKAIEDLTVSPGLASRNLAIIYVAGFDVINAQEKKFTSACVQEFSSKEVNPLLAAITAISFTAENLFPSHRGAFKDLKNKQYTTLRPLFSDVTWQASILFGESVAKKVLSLRSDDGSTSNLTYVPKNEIGKWKRTPPSFRPPELSFWSHVRPFVIESASQFRMPPPPDIHSEKFAQALTEVREIGAKNSKTRTPEQTEIAQFWSCFSYTSTPAGHWYRIATEIAKNEKLSLLETARLLALINLTMADAGIACWDTKFHYEAWRPIQAIRRTTEEKKWDSLLETPPHPEYVSGHGAFSGAGSKILQMFFPDKKHYQFSTTSSSLPGVIRSYNSFAECTEEICRSRLYGGIHFRYSNERGKELGERVAQFVYTHALTPIK